MKNDPERPENFAFIYRSTLFVGLNAVTNDSSNTISQRTEENLQWLDDNYDPHADKISAIFIMAYGGLEDLPEFEDALISKKKGEWRDKLVVYASSGDKTDIIPSLGGIQGLTELTIGRGFPFTDVQLDLTSNSAPRAGFRLVG